MRYQILCVPGMENSAHDGQIIIESPQEGVLKMNPEDNIPC